MTETSETPISPKNIFNRQEGQIANAEHIQLSLDKARVVIRTDTTAQTATYEVRRTANNPLKGSEQQFHIDQYPFTIRQDNGTWVLSDTLKEPRESNPRWAKTQVGREVVLTVPDNQDIEIHLKQGSINFEQFNGQARCHVDIGNVRMIDSRGQFQVQQDSGDTEIQTSQGSFFINTNTGALNIDGLIGTLNATLQTGEIKIIGLQSDQDSSIVSISSANRIEIIEPDIETVIQTQLQEGGLTKKAGFEFIPELDPSTTETTTFSVAKPKPGKTLKTSLVRIDADEGMKQLVAEPEIHKFASYLSEKTDRKSPFGVLSIIGKGHIIVSRKPGMTALEQAAQRMGII